MPVDFRNSATTLVRCDVPVLTTVIVWRVLFVPPRVR
jgi:hypothetical protein